MAEKRVSVRISAEGGAAVGAEFERLGLQGDEAFKRIEAGQKRAEASARVFERAIEGEARAFTRLKASVDPAFAAQQRYERIVTQVNRAVRLGATTQADATAVLVRARAQLDAYNATLRRVDATNTRGGLGFRNLGLQLSQVAQQGAVTGDYLRAAAIQLPDVLIGFGTIGIAAGVAAGALVPFATSLLDGADASQRQEEALTRLNATIDDYRAATDLARSSTADLTDRFGSQSEAIRESLELLQDIALSKALDSLNVSMAQFDAGRLRLLVDILSEGQGEIAAFDDNFNRAMAELQRDFRLSVSAAEDLLAAFEQMVGARGPEEVSLAARNLRGILLEIYGTVQNIPPAFRDMAENAARADVAASSIVGAMERAADATRVLASIDIASGIGAAASNAGALAQNLRAAAAAKVLLDSRPPPPSSGLSFGTFGVPGAGDPTTGAVSEFSFGDLLENGGRRQVVDLTRGLAGPDRGGRRGGAGASGAAREAGRLHNERLREAQRIYDRTRTAAERYNAELADLNELHETGYLSTEAFNRAVSQLEEDMSEVRFEGLQRAIDSVSDAMAQAIVQGENMGEALGRVFQKIAQDLIASGIKQLLSELFLGGGRGGGTAVGNVLAEILSFDGGGYTGPGPRSGGLDGRGGFMAMLHPQEVITDLTRTSPGRAGATEIIVRSEPGTVVEIARGEAVRVVKAGLDGYANSVAPRRQLEIARDPRVRY